MPAKVPGELLQSLRSPRRPALQFTARDRTWSDESPTVFDLGTTDIGISAVIAYERQIRRLGVSGLPLGPFHLEICPTAVCQIQCTFCSYEIRNGIGHQLSPEVLQQVLEDAQFLEVVGLYWSGGGDPLAAKNIAASIEQSSTFSGVAIQTNGISLDRLTALGVERTA